MSRGAYVTGAEDDRGVRYCIHPDCGVPLSSQMREAGLDYCEPHWNAIVAREHNPEAPPEYDLGIDEVFV